MRELSPLSKYTFSTDANYIAGVKGVETIGLGPGTESLAHISNEYLEVADIEKAFKIYLQLPQELNDLLTSRSS